MKRKPIAIFFALAGFLFLFSLCARADTLIDRFVFTTDPQIIKAGAISGALTVQAQDEAGNPHKSEETIDMIFSSTSSTGEFLNASGGSADPVMNKNTANRTFYYRDIARGTHTLTIKATGRISGKSWTASQSIGIDIDQGSTAPSGAVSVSSSISSSTPSGSSAYHTPVAALSPAPTIQAFAGEDHTALAGAEELFVGEAIGLVHEPITNARFWWNFGDGTTAEGKSVGHTYRDPGIYTLALSVSSGEYAASDYAAVRVLPNKIFVAEVVGGEEGWVRVVNPAAVMADIGGWSMEDDHGNVFYLPVHTMIGAGGEASFANRITGLISDKKVSLRYASGLLASAGESAAPSAPKEKIYNTNDADALTQVAVSVNSFLTPGKNTAHRVTDREVSPTATDTPASNTPRIAAGAGGAAYGTGFSPLFFIGAFALSMCAAAGFFIVRRVIG